MSEELSEIEQKDDSKNLVEMDYYDRIHKKWIKVEVTKEVADFMKADDQRVRREQNKYDYYNIPFSKIFDNKPENEHFLIDESQDIENILEQQEQEKLEIAMTEHNKVLVENSLYNLTPKQREVIELVLQNKTHQEIADILGIKDRDVVTKRIKRAKENIKKFIKNTEN